MPGQPSVLEDARELLQQRLAEIDDEGKRLERALQELGGKSTRRTPGRPRGGKPASSASKSAATPRKRRKRRGGTRADQVVNLIEKSPGIGTAELAKAMKIKPNYLYRVLGELKKEGRIKKDGRRYLPDG